ncbi:urea ABC transporter permease subunit UrtB [Gilvimarinus sp. F26214L]|uniref:urea ABC transporter permease subunit UrtB n=1 Tax=Gilvimarinus sp. DZF01 TaxID=3461371 RepID=UPI0040455F7B
MRKLLMLLCCLFAGQAAAEANTIAAAEVTGAKSGIPTVTNKTAAPTMDALLRELPTANLRESLDILTSLEDTGGRTMLPLFRALFDGDLYYDQSTFRLLSVTSSKGAKAVADAVSGELLPQIDPATLKRVRVSNRIRSHLLEAIARVNLLQGDLQERIQAAREMLDNMKGSNLPLLEQARAREEHPDVLEVLEAAIALQTLADGGDRQLRLEALKKLEERLENSVRNTMASMLDANGRNEQDPEVRAALAPALEAIEARVEFYSRIDQLFFGLSLGSVLLLAAVGLAVTFGVMGVINMAHGEMLMLGAYTTYVVQLAMPAFIDYSLWVAIPSAFIVAGSVGVLIQRYVIRYLNGRPLETLLATFGISLILQQAVRSIFSPLNRLVVSPEWMSGSLQINPVLSLTNNRLAILIFSLAVFFVLLLILKKTSLGLQVRAVSQNRDMAKAMGIRTDRVDAMTFGLGSGVAGIGGVALSQLTNVGPNLGQAYIIDSFMVVVFGGVGNLFGTLVGAFGLGLFTKFLEPVAGAVLAKILMLVAIILFIQKRPQGLFPQKGRSVE